MFCIDLNQGKLLDLLSMKALYTRLSSDMSFHYLKEKGLVRIMVYGLCMLTVLRGPLGIAI